MNFKLEGTTRKHMKFKWNDIQTLTVELDSMERMLIQMELTVIAGDQESYKISTEFLIKTNESNVRLE